MMSYSNPKNFIKILILFLLLINFRTVTSQNYCDTITLNSNIPDTVFLCNTDSIQITADSGFTSYHWSRGDTSQSVILRYSGMYWLTITDDSSCVSIDSVLLSLIDAGLNQSDTNLCYGDSLNVTSWVHSQNTNSVVLNGNNSYVSFSDDGFPVSNSERTFEAWVFNNGQTGQNCIFSYGDPIGNNDFSIYINQFDSLSVTINLDEYYCLQTIPQNTWTHIMIGTDPSNKYTFYINGNFANSNFITGNFNTQLSGTAYIGRSVNSISPAYFNGSVDEVRIWNRIVSGGEVIANMQFHTNTGTDSHLLRFYDFNFFIENFSNDIYGFQAELNTATTSNAIPFTDYKFRFLWDNGSTDPNNPITYYGSEVTSVSINDDISLCVHDLNITVVPKPDLTDSIFICNMDQYQLNTLYNYSSYIWNTGSTSNSIDVLESGNYFLTVSDAGCTYSDSSFISLLSVDILTSDTALCPGDSLVLEAISSTGNYLWNNDSQDSVLLISPTGSSVFSVAVSDGFNTCFDQVSVTVYPVYDVGLDDTLSICNQNSGLLTTNNAFFASYLWSSGDTSNFSIVSQGGYYSVTATDLNGCTSSDESYVQFLLIDIMENDTLVCNGLSLDLNAVSNLTDYLWSTGETGSVITVANSGTYSVALSSGSYSCSDEVNVTISPEIILALSDTLASCVAEVYTLNPGSTVYDYIWNTGANTPEIQVQSSGIYIVTATNSDGCHSLDTSVVSIIDVVMSINDTLVCEGAEVIVSTNSTQYNYNWSNGATDALIFDYPVIATNYHVLVSDDYQTCNYVISVDVINVMTGPIIGNDSVWGDSTEIYYVNPNPGSTYSWYVSGGTFSSDSLDYIEIVWGPGNQGFISITETTSEGCVGDPVEMYITIHHPVSIVDIYNFGDITISPNPMHRQTNISIPEPFVNGSIQLYNIAGKLLFEDNLNGNNSYSLYQPNLSKGIYLIRLSDNHAISKKLLVY